MSDEILSVSEPKVMQSAAGYYVGQSCEVKYTWEDGETHVQSEPYDRLSGYFSTAEIANLYLMEVS
tara:strand:+ start:493 stop:690 length:198 start_codon:yes stop_codon:yes gene_type:complete